MKQAPTKVLVVDDDQTNRDLVMRSLIKEGYEIREAGDGKEAIHLAKSFAPDLIILDIMMPGMTGYEVCNAIRSNPSTKNVSVLFLSARSRASTKLAVEQAGGNAFMEKPFSIRELRAKIKEILNTHTT